MLIVYIPIAHKSLILVGLSVIFKQWKLGIRWWVVRSITCFYLILACSMITGQVLLCRKIVLYDSKPLGGCCAKIFLGLKLYVELWV